MTPQHFWMSMHYVTRKQALRIYPFTPPPLSVHQALSGSNLPQSSTQTPAIPPLFHAVSSVPGAPFSLSTASPLPIPPNALALEPPPVANSIRSQILSEIQNIGTGGGSTPHPSTSLFRTNIPLNHPLKPLLEASLNSILQAVSPRTLQSYLTAWKSFKTFHSTYNLPFPTFSLLAITSFISHLNIKKKKKKKKLQTSSIKGYLSGLQFFHKLLYGSPSAHIANSQTSLLIKGIQKTNPTRPDSRQPITLKNLDQMHFHPPQRLPFCPHRPHARRHVYPGLLRLPQMLWARHLIQFRPSHPPHYLRSSGAGRRNHFLHH